MYRELPCSDTAAGAQTVRDLAAAMLRAAGAALDRLALRVARVERPVASADSVIEFHAEAGAPEGALYVNGHLVGHVAGVDRL